MSSSIPAALRNFITLSRAVLPASTMVYFGKPFPVYTSPIVMRITEIQGTQDPAEIAPSYKREEHYSFMCQITSLAGDQPSADHPDVWVDRLDEVFDTWADITIAVGNDPQLTGVPGGTGNAGAVRWAQCADMVFTPEADTKGMSQGCLTFEVQCVQRITSLT